MTQEEALSLVDTWEIDGIQNHNIYNVDSWEINGI